MAKLELKTKPTDASVDAFIDAVPDAQRREDERLAQLRGDRTSTPVPFDPDRTNTAPIQYGRTAPSAGTPPTIGSADSSIFW